jgi:hypothetical protein
MRFQRGLILSFASLLLACGASAAGSDTGTTQQALEALVPLQGCGEVETYLRQRLVDSVNRQVDDAIKSLLDSSHGGGCYYGGGFADAGMAVPTAGGASSSSSSSSSSGSSGSAADMKTGATSTSTTNNQVAGVDEADFIKNDNEFLYVVANGAFRILKAWPAETMAEIAKVTLEGEPKKLFVEGDRALVYVSVPRPGNTSSVGSSPVYYPRGSNECTYGYDCVPSGDGTATKLVVLDIADRKAPKKLRELLLSGSLLAARRIGDAVHTVVVDAPQGIEGLKSYPDFSTIACTGQDDTSFKARAVAAWEDLRAQNLAKVATADVMKGVPYVSENGAPAVPACTGYYRPSTAEGTTFTSLVSIDINGGAPTSATVVSDPGVVYASETGLYMSVPHTKTVGYAWYGDMANEEQASTVHEFRIGATPTLTGYEASGIVKGRVLNQFALDEHEGHLRLATTTGHAPDAKSHSTMSILERKGNSLVLTGKVDNIAPSEDIRSVRFDGSRGFVVTFKKTDPLYVFDLGDPNAPRISGELKIPGFSTYMHMMDASHLLTIGYDAADQGSFAWFQGVMLQVFDVSDMNNPQLAHKELIGTRGSSSEALADHLAFNYYAPKNILALPMTICEGGDGLSGYGTNMTFSGLIVYDVTAAGGFSKRGQVSHPTDTAGNGYSSTGCSNWWANASSEVKRSVIMDDVVFSISDRRVKANNLDNLATDIAVVSLEQP